MKVNVQLFYESILMIIFIFMQINHYSCGYYDGENKGYTSVPTDINNGVQTIKLRNNNISYINDDSFNEANTDFSNVNSIYLSGNRINNFSERALEGFHMLEYIRLNNNRLRNIIFKEEDIPKLLSLQVEDNQFTQLPTFYGFFQSFSQLYANRNFISFVAGDDFENITNVEYIYLSNNRLILFESRQELPGLLQLDLANNSLQEIPTLGGIYKSLRDLNIQNNNISFKSLLMLNEKINGSEKSLTSLNVAGNEDFAKNLFTIINFLEQFSNLFEVGFSNLKISKMFSMSLTYFDLSKNNISGINEEFFTNTTIHFSIIILNSNPIEFLPNLYEYTKSADSHNIILHLREIRFQCGKLCWMTRIG